MFSNLMIRTRLALAMGFLGLLMAIGAALGVTGIAFSNADQKELYSNDLASASAHGKFDFFCARGRLVLDRIAAQPDRADIASLEQHAREQFAIGDKGWQAYRALPSDGQERQLTDALEAKRIQAINGVAFPRSRPPPKNKATASSRSTAPSRRWTKSRSATRRSSSRRRPRRHRWKSRPRA